MQARHMHITVSVYDANALITFVEPDIPLIVGLSLADGGAGDMQMACLIRYW